MPKINPVVGQFRLTLRPQEGGVTARQLRNAYFSAAHPQEKKKNKTVNFQVCGKLKREPQFHASGRRRRHQWVFGSERTSSTRTDDDSRESEVGAGESVQSREKCVIGENFGFYLLNFIFNVP